MNDRFTAFRLQHEIESSTASNIVPPASNKNTVEPKINHTTKQQIMEQTNLCQSCGMPLQHDPNKGGTNKDGSKSTTYCSFCFAEGTFTDGCTTVEEKIEKNVKIAVGMNMPEEKARELATAVLPTLERWK